MAKRTAATASDLAFARDSLSDRTSCQVEWTVSSQAFTQSLDAVEDIGRRHNHRRGHDVALGDALWVGSLAKGIFTVRCRQCEQIV
jgi:hypothetical protein